MTDLFDNPMGLCGFEFVEFASPIPNTLEPLFEQMGFSLVAKHRSKDVVLYRQGDINAWDWDAVQYDAVAAIFIQFSTPPERARVFAGLVRALKPGGLLILQGYGTGQLAYGTGGPKNIEQLYTDTLLRGAFAALDILHLATHDEEVDEGPGHSGMSALVDLVARRPA